MGKKNRKKQSALLQESTLIAEDLISETSSNSGATFKDNIKGFEEPENEDIAEYCVLEEKIDKALEDLSHKNITLRENALTEIIKIFQLQYIPDIIEERQVTLSSLIEKSLKKGQSTKEQILGATLVPIFFIQIYCSLPTEEYWSQFEPILQIIYKDNSSNIQVREACLLAHTFCVFALQTSDHNPSAVGAAMDDLEACFKRRSPKFQNQKPRDIDDPLPLHQPDDEILIPRINAFRKSALLSWALLLTVAPPTKLTQSITRLIPYFTDNLLDTQVNYELRVPTAQCLAVCYELDDGLLLEGDTSIRTSLTEICEKLRTLMGENVKFISKRDQRLHRSIFRQVLGTLSSALDRHKDKGDGFLPPLPSGEKLAYVTTEGLKEESVKFGSETLQLATWVSKLRYETFCQILGSGINHHLKENEMLRQIFDLGPPVNRSNAPGSNKITKEAKHKRDLEMASSNKARTLSLQKARRYKDNAIQLCVEGE